MKELLPKTPGPLSREGAVFVVSDDWRICLASASSLASETDFNKGEKDVPEEQDH